MPRVTSDKAASLEDYRAYHRALAKATVIELAREYPTLGYVKYHQGGNMMNA